MFVHLRGTVQPLLRDILVVFDPNTSWLNRASTAAPFLAARGMEGDGWSMLIYLAARKRPCRRPKQRGVDDQPSKSRLVTVPC